MKAGLTYTLCRSRCRDCVPSAADKPNMALMLCLRRNTMKNVKSLLAILVVVLLILMVTTRYSAKEYSGLSRLDARPIEYDETQLVDTNLYASRRLEVKKQCSARPSKRPWQPRGYLHKTLPIFYCKIPKVASTFMGGFLPQLFHSSKLENCFAVVEDHTSMFWFKKKHTSVSKAIATSFSYVIVREPYTRLFSAYENKLYMPQKFYKKLGTDVIATVRRNKDDSQYTGHDVTFTELIEYVTLKYSKGDAINEHLEPQHERCDPCAVRFDFIGKIETMEPDIVQLVASLRDSKMAVFNDSDVNKAHELEAKTRADQLYGPIGHLFKEIENIGKYKHPTRKDLFMRTWSSFQIRGIVHKDYDMPFVNDNVINDVTQEMFKEALQDAVEKSKGRKEETKLQREEALIQAYHSVPLNVMDKLRKFVMMDCQRFDYEHTPEKLFSRTSVQNKTDFNYFKRIDLFSHQN